MFDRESTLPDQAVLQKMYIASPSALKPEELAGYVEFKNSEEAIEKIRIWIKDYNWDEIRERRWANIRESIMARRT